MVVRQRSINGHPVYYIPITSIECYPGLEKNTVSVKEVDGEEYFAIWDGASY
jgi:hypothetical protein